jgi:hypothetical protein
MSVGSSSTPSLTLTTLPVSSLTAPTTTTQQLAAPASRAAKRRGSKQEVGGSMIGSAVGGDVLAISRLSWTGLLTSNEQPRQCPCCNTMVSRSTIAKHKKQCEDLVRAAAARLMMNAATTAAAAAATLGLATSTISSSSSSLVLPPSQITMPNDDNTIRNSDADSQTAAISPLHINNTSGSNGNIVPARNSSRGIRRLGFGAAYDRDPLLLVKIDWVTALSSITGGKGVCPCCNQTIIRKTMNQHKKQCEEFIQRTLHPQSHLQSSSTAVALLPSRPLSPGVVISSTPTVKTESTNDSNGGSNSNITETITSSISSTPSSSHSRERVAIGSALGGIVARYSSIDWVTALMSGRKGAKRLCPCCNQLLSLKKIHQHRAECEIAVARLEFLRRNALAHDSHATVGVASSIDNNSGDGSAFAAAMAMSWASFSSKASVSPSLSMTSSTSTMVGPTMTSLSQPLPITSFNSPLTLTDAPTLATGTAPTPSSTSSSLLPTNRGKGTKRKKSEKQLPAHLQAIIIAPDGTPMPSPPTKRYLFRPRKPIKKTTVTKRARKILHAEPPPPPSPVVTVTVPVTDDATVTSDGTTPAATSSSTSASTTTSMEVQGDDDDSDLEENVQHPSTYNDAQKTQLTLGEAAEAGDLTTVTTMLDQSNTYFPLSCL